MECYNEVILPYSIGGARIRRHLTYTYVHLIPASPYISVIPSADDQFQFCDWLHSIECIVHPAEINNNRDPCRVRVLPWFVRPFRFPPCRIREGMFVILYDRYVWHVCFRGTIDDAAAVRPHQPCPHGRPRCCRPAAAAPRRLKHLLSHAPPPAHFLE